MEQVSDSDGFSCVRQGCAVQPILFVLISPSLKMFMLVLFLCGTAFCSGLSLTPCNVTHEKEEHGIQVDCHGRGLTEIPKHFPVNTTSINLSDNLISSVKNYSFIDVPKLRSLNLSSNAISSIEPHSFWNCQSLKNLNIKDNNICVNGTVFEHLGNLQELAIDDCYDREIFKPLIGLTTIEIVANSECHFQGFHFLTHITNLVITGAFSCRNYTFVELSDLKIRSLRIEGELLRIDINALAPLEHLQELIFFNTRCEISKPLDALYGLVGRNLTTLTLDRVRNNGASQSMKEVEDRTLTSERLKYLSLICVSNFSAQNNFILFFDIVHIQNSPIANCLHRINLRRNMISYLPIQAVYNFQKLTKLEHLDFSNQAKLPVDPSPSPNSLIMSDISVWKTHVEGNFFLTLPEYLKSFIAGRVSNNIGHLSGNITITNGENVKKVDFSANELNTLQYIYGIPNVEYVDLSGNANLLLPNDFFCSSQKIETLKVTDMSFRQNVIDSQAKALLSCLPRLRTLDISGNRLIKLPSDLFKLNPMLEYLDLSRNIFISIPVHLKLHPHLRLLDVSSNSFGSLDKKTTDDIDDHYQNTGDMFQVHLKGNVFECSCSNLQFLFWLSETEVLREENSEISCITEDGNIIKTRDITINMLKFWRKCKGFETFALSMIIGPSLLCCLFVALLIETNKTKLAFFIIHALKYQIPKRKRKDFKRDMYVSYADADYRWACFELCAILEERSINLFIWDRDSVPGDCTAEVITETVNQCWKTILYFTENYERDAWSYLTTMAAVNYVDNLYPERLILLLPENESPRVPECLLQVVPECCIFYVPRDIKRNHSFWDELERAIKKDT